MFKNSIQKKNKVKSFEKEVIWFSFIKKEVKP